MRGPLGGNTRTELHLTLILTQAGLAGAIQVTDRLTSQRIAGQVVPYDRQSNKNVLFLTLNGMLTIAYTGLSFVDRTPTDQWIAETLNGEKVPPGRSGAPATIGIRHSLRRLPDIGRAAALLRDQIQLAAERPSFDLQKRPITIVLAGWIWYRCKRPRPIAGYILRQANGVYVVRWVNRHFGRRFWFSACPGDYLAAEEHRAVQTGLRNKNHIEAEQWLVDHIRMVAARSPGVGSNSISITISPPKFGQVLVRYRSLTPTLATPAGAGMPAQIPVAFAPWLVSDGLIHAPSMIGGPGAQIQHLGHWQVRFEAPELPIPPNSSRLVAFTQTQTRRPSP